MFSSLGIVTSRKTHSGRGSGACFAEMSGCQEESIRRLGNWNQSNAKDGCYLRSLPRSELRGIAGFFPDGSFYELNRGVVEPCEELQKKIPEVGMWIQGQERNQEEKNLFIFPFI